MIEPLHPAQLRAVDKLKGLKVGALYMEQQDGKLRTVIELVRHRFRRGKIERVLWLCTRRKIERLTAGIFRYDPQNASKVEVWGMETLSHNLGHFLRLLDKAKERRTMLIIDNGLLVKNFSALRTQRVIALSKVCPYRLLISDIPFACHVSDMFAQWYVLDWRILGYSTYWGFCVNHLRDIRRPDNMDYITRAIEPYCAQVLREDVQPTPGRREYVWQFQLPEEAMAEYRRVSEMFMWKTIYSSTGIYRLLQACQHVICGRRVAEEYPLRTEPLYQSDAEDPRLGALMEALPQLDGQEVLILCRYKHECDRVAATLRRRWGHDSVSLYTPERQEAPARYTVMNIFTDERETARLTADTIVYYSSDWNWRKRQEKEQQCMSALPGGSLTVVSLAAADTIDLRILRCVWNKDNLVTKMREELAVRLSQGGTE